MPTIQNFALHPFQLPGEPRTLTFLAGTLVAPGKVNPTETEITEAELSKLKAHSIAGEWFSPSGLVVKSDETKPADQAPAVETPPAAAPSAEGEAK